MALPQEVSPSVARLASVSQRESSAISLDRLLWTKRKVRKEKKIGTRSKSSRECKQKRLQSLGPTPQILREVRALRTMRSRRIHPHLFSRQRNYKLARLKREGTTKDGNKLRSITYALYCLHCTYIRSRTLLDHGAGCSFCSAICTVRCSHLFLIFLVQTLHQALGEFFTVQVLSNKDKFVDARLVGSPRFLSRAKVDLFVHTLKNKFRIALPLKGQQAFGTVNVGGSFT